tara:strand:+ start:7281 stop:7478 length:198 start_codon:yes stop_codon:yes gene_type:complete
VNDHLGTISLLLLIFFLSWFAWDQHKVIQKQNLQIQELKQQIVIQNMMQNMIINTPRKGGLYNIH